MILDENLEFADDVAVGAPNNTTVNVGDVIDLGLTSRELSGGGKQLWLVIQVTTAFTSGGAATVSFLLSSDAGATIAVDGTQTSHWESDTIAVASLTAKYTLVVPLPAQGDLTYERYLGVQVRENAGQALTAGKINAFLTLDPRRYRSFADATN